jgi:Mannosyltransferase (PIG-V)
VRLPLSARPRRALHARRRAARTDAATTVGVRAVLLSRALVWVAGLSALALFGKDGLSVAVFDPIHVTEPFHSSLANDLFAPTARWDTVWYVWISRLGYYTRQATAFFPLYPLLIRGGTALFRSEVVVGTLISLGSMLLGLVMLHRLVELDMGEREARLTVILVAFFPTAFFLSAVYTEALYLALSVGAIYAARLDRWAWAGALGALAAATRSSGILIVVPLALLYLYGPRASTPAGAATSWWRPRHRPARSALWLALVPLGLIAFMAYLALFAHDSPLAPFQAEDLYWGRHFSAPFAAVWDALKLLPSDVRGVWTGAGAGARTLEPLTPAYHALIDIGFLAFAAIGFVASWRRVPFAYIAYTFALLAEGLSYPTHIEPLSSFPRYVLVMFPIFIGWAGLLANRRRLTFAVIGASTLALAVLSGLWTMWAWVA